VIVKICGLRRPEHASAAASAGADLLGLVFAPGKRRVSLAEGAAIAATLHQRPGRRPLLVGLFVNEPPATVSAVARDLGLDLVQLSGNEPPADADAIPLPVLKAIRLDGSATEAAWMARAARTAAAPTLTTLAADPTRVLLLVDAHVPGAYGGTGRTADWPRAAELAARLPLLLAGGLNPSNVARAISIVRPLGVDVSSGVETAGVKDVAKIEAFIAAARSA